MSLQGDNNTNKVTFDGEPKNYVDFKWKVEQVFYTLGIIEVLSKPQDEALADFKDASTETETKATKAFDSSYLKGLMFLTSALQGRAIRLVRDVPRGNIYLLWSTLTAYFEGSGTRTVDTLLQQVDKVNVGKTQASIADAIAQYNALYQELDDQGEKTSDTRKISLLRSRLRNVDASFELYYQAFMLQKEAGDRTWTKFCTGVRANAAALSSSLSTSHIHARGEQALLAGDGKYKKSFKPAANKSIKGECWNCGKIGHAAKDCRGVCRKPDCAGKGKHARQQCRNKSKDKRLTYGSTSSIHGQANLASSPSSTDTHKITEESTGEQGGWFATDVSAYASFSIHTQRKTPLRILDSGCGSHMLCGAETLFDKREGPTRVFNTAGKGKLELNQHAVTKLCLKDGKNKNNVWRVSGVVADSLPVSLLSVSQLDQKRGYYVVYGGGKVHVVNQPPTFNKEHVIGSGKLVQGGVYALDDSDDAMFAHKAPTKNPKYIDAMVLHGRLGHAAIKSMDRFCKKQNLVLTGVEELSTCLTCRLGKAKDRNYSKDAHFERSTTPGDYWHIDLMGPFRTSTWGGKRFALICTDDASGYRVVYLLTTKGEQIEAFKKLYAWVFTQLDVKIKRVRTDGDWTTDEWNKFKDDKGIEQLQTTSHHPRSNGAAERANGVVTQMARCLLIAANLPPMFFGETLSAAVYLLNRSCSVRSGSEKTPVEWIRKKSVLSHQLRAYGSHAWVTSTESTGKAKPRAKEGILIGYDEQRRAYRIFCPSERKILVSDAVVFDEKKIGLHTPRRQVNNLSFDDLLENDVVSTAPPTTADSIPKPVNTLPTASESNVAVVPESKNVTTDNDIKTEIEPADKKHNSTLPTESDTGKSSVVVLSDDDEEQDDTTSESITATTATDTTTVSDVRRSGRYVKPTAAILEYIADQPSAFLTESVSVSEKKAWAQEEWRTAMKTELDGLRKLGTFEVVPRPTDPDKSVIGGRWVLVKKKATDGTTKYKARYVCKGYSQIHGIDFDETWSPTLRGQSIRLLVSLAAADGSRLRHLDVKNAFANAPIEEEIYVEIPYGATNDSSDNVWRLKKALYGLKQAGREWNKLFSKGLRELPFKQTVSDPCLFVGQGQFAGIIVGVYVDDCIVKYKDSTLLNKLLIKLQQKFPIKDEGDLISFVGVEVKHTSDRVILHQSTYLLSVLRRFKYDDSNTVSTPVVASNSTPAEGKRNKSRLEDFDMRALVGSLLYLSIHTRPDIAYAVAKLAQNVANPTPIDYQAAARILRYLNGTRTMGISFKKKSNPTLTVYVDSSWGDYPDGKSHSGHIVFFGGPVDWTTKKQNMVALSSSEAELIAAVEAGKSTMWYRSLLGELGYKQAKPTVMFEDNTGAIVLAHTSVIGKRTRHMNIRYNCINDWVSSGYVLLQKIHTTKNIADLLTKPLDKTLFLRFASKLVSSL